MIKDIEPVSELGSDPFFFTTTISVITRHPKKVSVLNFQDEPSLMEV